MMSCPKGKGSQQDDHTTVWSVLLHIVQEARKLILDATKALLVLRCL